ncbi:ATP-binding protein [Arthrobacter sp. Hz1]
MNTVKNDDQVIEPVVVSTPSVEASGGNTVEITSLVPSDEHVGEIPVKISYGIIERFSEGLYSSPNKTFEELITNSYDAGAREVWVYLSSDLSANGATLLVIDDGESMTLEGLADLWKIGESRKRSNTPPPGRSKPVGKFGIGKLATYVLAKQLTYIVHRDGEYLAVTMDYGRVAHTAELMDGVNLSLDVVRLTKQQALDAVEQSLAGTAVAQTSKVLEALPNLEHWTAALLSNLKPTARDIKLGRLRWVLRSALPLNPEFQLWMNDDEVKSSKVDGEELWSFLAGKQDNTLPKSAERPWGPGEGIEVEVLESGKTVKVPAIRLPNAGIVRGQATLYRQPLARGRSEDMARSHGFFVRVRGRLINLYEADFSVGPELRHGTLTRFRMEVDADDLDDQVASARENLKESKPLQELKNYLLAVFNKARAVSTEQDDGDVISNIAKNGRLAKPSTALSQGPLRRMLQRAVSGEIAVAHSLGLSDKGVGDAEKILADGGDVIDSVLLEEHDSAEPMAVYDPVRRAVILNQTHPFVNNYIGGKTVSEPLKLLGLSEILTQAYLLDENISPEIIERVMRRRDAFLRELTLRFPRSAPIIAQRLRDATNDENALEDAVGDALELLGFSVIRLGGAQHGADGIATARLGRRGDVSSSYAFTYDAKSTKDSVREVLSENSDVAIATKTPGRIRADTARTSVLRVHREKASARHGLEVVPSFTLLIAPDFQGALDAEGLINDVCANDEITAIRVDDLARLVELFALQGLNPADLRPLFDTRSPEATRAWVNAQSTEARIPRPPVAVLVETLVENSEKKAPIVFESLAAFLATKNHDMSVSEIESLVRGLAALAPKSVYTDGRYVALNASPAALYAEIRESLDVFDPELVAEYLDTVPSAV